MLNRVKREIKAIAKDLAVAFFFTTFILFLTGLIFTKEINFGFNLINKLAVMSYTVGSEKNDIKIDKAKKRLVSYPSYGDMFGSIKIASVNIDSPLYHGESLKVLRYGAGHHAGSYFPGEGGTIIIAGHNTKGRFYTLPKVNIGDEVIIETSYGTYTYKITSTEIENATVLGNRLTIRTDEETLMIYTCYPVEYPGYKDERFVAYASLVGEKDA